MTWTPVSSRSLSQRPRSSGVCEESATAENLRAATPAAVPDADEAEQLRQAHAGYYLLFAEQAAHGLVGGSQAEWCRRSVLCQLVAHRVPGLEPALELEERICGRVPPLM